MSGHLHRHQRARDGPPRLGTVRKTALVSINHSRTVSTNSKKLITRTLEQPLYMHTLDGFASRSHHGCRVASKPGGSFVRTCMSALNDSLTGSNNQRSALITVWNDSPTQVKPCIILYLHPPSARSDGRWARLNFSAAINTQVHDTMHDTSALAREAKQNALTVLREKSGRRLPAVGCHDNDHPETRFTINPKTRKGGVDCKTSLEPVNTFQHH